MRTKYEKRLCYIHEAEQLGQGTDHPWREERSRSLTIWKKQVLKERLPSFGRNHAECHAEVCEK